MPLWARLTLPRKLAASLRDARVSLIQARSPATAWVAHALARRLEIKWIATLHLPFVARSLAGRFVERRQARADAVIAVSEYVARDALQHFPAAGRAGSRRIQPGINFDRFDPAIVRADRRDQAGRRTARARRQPSHPVSGAFRRGPRPEDPDRGDEATGPRRRVLPAAGLDRASRRRSRRNWNARSRPAELHGRVQIGPYVDDMPAAYMLADVVVATGGARQGFSRALVEAQAMGRPVVAEEGGGAAETVRAGVTGWLAPQGDPASLAEALHSALSLVDRAPRRTGARGAGAGAQPLCAGTVQPPAAAALRTAVRADESAASACSCPRRRRPDPGDAERRPGPDVAPAVRRRADRFLAPPRAIQQSSSASGTSPGTTRATPIVPAAAPSPVDTQANGGLKGHWKIERSAGDPRWARWLQPERLDRPLRPARRRRRFPDTRPFPAESTRRDGR